MVESQRLYVTGGSDGGGSREEREEERKCVSIKEEEVGRDAILNMNRERKKGMEEGDTTTLMVDFCIRKEHWGPAEVVASCSAADSTGLFLP